MLKKTSLCSVYSSLQCCVSAHCQSTAGSSTSPSCSASTFRTAGTRHRSDQEARSYSTKCGWRGNKRLRLDQLPTSNQIRSSVTLQTARENSTSSPQNRTYATVRPSPSSSSSSKTYDFRDNLNWPCHHTRDSHIPTRVTPVPTPYDIFELEKGAVYEKRKFYELVKMYHPDRTSCMESGSGQVMHQEDVVVASGSGPSLGTVKLTHLQRLERYRLVVQAHEILSDPIKRRAYDAYGTGWGERANGNGNGNGNGSPGRHSRGYASQTAGAEGKNYGYGPEDDASPFSNATWEDWEKWYRRNDDPHMRQAYAGTYFNPNAFASFVILLAVISGIAQATRAGQYSGKLEERAQNFTEQTSRFLAERAEGYGAGETKMSADGRVKHFLQRRDPSRYGLKDEEEETYRKHFAGDHQHMLPPGLPPPPPAPRSAVPMNSPGSKLGSGVGETVTRDDNDNSESRNSEFHTLVSHRNMSSRDDG